MLWCYFMLFIIIDYQFFIKSMMCDYVGCMSMVAAYHEKVEM